MGNNLKSAQQLQSILMLMGDLHANGCNAAGTYHAVLGQQQWPCGAAVRQAWGAGVLPVTSAVAVRLPGEYLTESWGCLPLPLAVRLLCIAQYSLSKTFKWLLLLLLLLYTMMPKFDKAIAAAA